MNVLLANKLKIRAVVDTGSTNSVMSSALYNDLKDHGELPLIPTSNTFKGVSGPKSTYTGALAALPIQLTDKLEITLNVSVVPNEDKFLLLGNDAIGGTYSTKLTRLASSDTHSFFVLQDAQGVQDLVQFVRNRERQEIPVPVMKLDHIEPEGPDEV